MGWHITLIVISVLALVVVIVIIIIIVVSYHQMGELDLSHRNLFLKMHSCMVEFTIGRNLSVYS